MNRQIHILVISVTSVMLVVIFFILFFLILNIIVDQVEERGRSDIKQFQQLIDDSRGSLPEYQMLAEQQAIAGDCHIIIVDMDSFLLADSGSSSTGLTGGRYINANLSAAKEDGEATSIVGDRKSVFLSIAVGEVLETPQGPIVVSFNYRTDAMRRLVLIMVLFAASFLFISGAQIFLLTTYALLQYRKPIHTLLQHTKKAAGSFGGFSKISIDTYNPELIQLVEDFNTLIDRYDLLIASDNAKYSKINSLLSHIGTGIMIVDPDNSVSLINPRAEELLNIDKGYLFSERSDFTSESDLFNRVILECGRVNTDKRARSLTLEAPGGVIIDISVEAMFSKYKPYDHSGSLVLIRDVTEIRRLEKLKDEFVSNVSHELRTPLTVINGFAQTLQSWETLDSADRDSSLTIIEVETERLKKLISELLMFSRIEGEMDTVDLVLIDPVPLLAEAVESLKPIADEKTISFSVRASPEGFLKLYGRVSWFKHIAINLLENAIKYSPENSEILISLTESKNESIILEIKDRGIGIDKKDLPRIFERFYRVEKSRNSKIAGSGLGLAIVSLMVEEFKGSISVESEPGKGSVFTVIFPGADSPSGGNRLNIRG